MAWLLRLIERLGYTIKTERLMLFLKLSKMHVNFLHPFFKPIADCDVVSSDGYTVQNLVSSDFRENSRGFLAAHFIKPPALLLFQLPFPVHVESMIIKPKVGSQISSGIAVLVAGIATKGKPHVKDDTTNHKPTVFSKKKRINNGLPLSSEKRNNCQQNTARNCQKQSPDEGFIHNHNYELNVTPKSVKGEHSHFFSQVAWLTDREGRTFHMENSLFQERFPVQGINQVGRFDIQRGEFQRLSNLRKVTHVVLKIARLSGSSVPAIGKVEIWGQPSACCQPEVLEYALQVQKKIQGGIHSKTATTEDQNVMKADSKHYSSVLATNCSSNPIPDDFMDPITCEIMTVPLLLPSGHNIDTVTLEKHITAERTWGRLPSDPFTGKLFSEFSKPLPNSSLKVRIDQFLLSSGLNNSVHERTVGRESMSRRESNQTKSKLLKANKEPSENTARTTKAPPGSNEVRGVCHDLHLLGARYQQRVPNFYVHKSEQKEVELGHEETVTRSLDSAVLQTLSGLHRFTRNRIVNHEKVTVSQSSTEETSKGLRKRLKRTAPETSETWKNHIEKKPNVSCVSCDHSLLLQSIFHLPCQHIMCRSCLLKETQKSDNESACKLCKTKYRQTDVVRVHNV